MQVDSFIPFFGRDFLAATMGWTAEERGHYVTLLITQWEQGGLPADTKRLELISLGVSESWDTLAPKFPLCDDGQRRNQRMEEHRQKAQGLASTRSEKARRAAQARWNASGNAPSNAPSNASASAEQSASAMPKHEASKISGGLESGGGARIPKKTTVADAPSMRQAMPQTCPPSPSPSPQVLREISNDISLVEENDSVLLPLDGEGEWSATPQMVAEWRETYPQLNVPAELRKARQWLLDNPSRRKTKRGMRRFIGHWMANASTGKTAKVKELASL